MDILLTIGTFILETFAKIFNLINQNWILSLSIYLLVLSFIGFLVSKLRTFGTSKLSIYMGKGKEKGK